MRSMKFVTYIYTEQFDRHLSSKGGDFLTYMDSN